MDNSKITFKIDTSDPISVEDFTNALIAFKNEYKYFSKNERDLCISEVRKGSFEVEFLSIVVPSLFAAVEYSSNIIEFASHISNIKNFLINGDKQSQEVDANNIPDKISIDNSFGFINPTFNAPVYFISDNGQVLEQIAASEAIIAKQNYTQRIKTLEPPTGKQEIEVKVYKKVPFEWFQTRFDRNKVNTGNKGNIASINDSPVNVIFEDDNSKTKQEMTTSIDGVDWQERIYIIDVEVIRKGDKILKYKILHNYMNESIVDEPNLFNTNCD